MERLISARCLRKTYNELSGNGRREVLTAFTMCDGTQLMCYGSSAGHRPPESTNKWGKKASHPSFWSFKWLLLLSLHKLLAIPPTYLFFCLCFIIFPFVILCPNRLLFSFWHDSLLIFCSLRALTSPVTDVRSSPWFAFCLHLLTFSSRTSFSSYRKAWRSDSPLEFY
jgi:hypothetical protein